MPAPSNSETAKDRVDDHAKETGQHRTFVGKQLQKLNLSPSANDYDESIQDGFKDAQINRKYKSARTTATRFRYPFDVGTDSQPNSIIFNINARSNSALGSETVDYDESGGNITGTKKAWGEAQEEYNEDYSSQNRAKSEMSKAAVATTAAVGVTTILYGGRLIGNSGKNSANSSGKAEESMGSKVKSIVKSGVAAGTVVAAGVGITNMARNTQTTRLLTSIQLHVPHSLVAQYSADWNETELGMAGLVGSGAMSVSEAIDSMVPGGDNASGLFEAGGRGLLSAAANLPKELGVNADFAGLIQTTSKKVNNPFKEQLFKAMGFRKFAFRYLFSPKNAEEYSQIENIINEFKYHMHPERSPDDVFLIYPSEFDIQFKFKGEDNTNVPKISTCALTDMKLTHGADGVFTTFKDTAGAPSEIGMELAFTELETLTTSRINAGY